jgi:hypothetical protein
VRITIGRREDEEQALDATEVTGPQNDQAGRKDTGVIGFQLNCDRKSIATVQPDTTSHKETVSCRSRMRVH